MTACCAQATAHCDSRRKAARPAGSTCAGAVGNSASGNSPSAPLVTTIRLFAGLPAGFDRFEQQRVKFVGETTLNGRNIRDHRDLRLERFAQPADFGFKVDRGHRHAGKSHLAVLGHRPDKALVLAEIVRQQRLTWPQRCFDFIDRWRLRIDHIGIGRKALVDILLCGFAVGAQFVDLRIDPADRLIVALIGRQASRLLSVPSAA